MEIFGWHDSLASRVGAWTNFKLQLVSVPFDRPSFKLVAMKKFQARSCGGWKALHNACPNLEFQRQRRQSLHRELRGTYCQSHSNHVQKGDRKAKVKWTALVLRPTSVLRHNVTWGSPKTSSDGQIHWTLNPWLWLHARDIPRSVSFNDYLFFSYNPEYSRRIFGDCVQDNVPN